MGSLRVPRNAAVQIYDYIKKKSRVILDLNLFFLILMSILLFSPYLEVNQNDLMLLKTYVFNLVLIS